MYAQTIGGGVTKYKNGYGNSKQVAYILHTGSSWHGRIGKSTVIVRFVEPWTTQKLHIAAEKMVSAKGGLELNMDKPMDALVLWSGPCKPDMDSNTLTFVRNSWRPRDKDDITISYNYK